MKTKNDYDFFWLSVRWSAAVSAALILSIVVSIANYSDLNDSNMLLENRTQEKSLLKISTDSVKKSNELETQSFKDISKFIFGASRSSRQNMNNSNSVGDKLTVIKG